MKQLLIIILLLLLLLYCRKDPGENHEAYRKLNLLYRIINYNSILTMHEYGNPKFKYSCQLSSYQCINYYVDPEIITDGNFRCNLENTIPIQTKPCVIENSIASCTRISNKSNVQVEVYYQGFDLDLAKEKCPDKIWTNSTGGQSSYIYQEHYIFIPEFRL
jgi:hypothetical protein